MARFQAQVGCFEKDLSQEESTISPGSNALKHCVGSSDGAGANWVTTLREDHIHVCKLIADAVQCKVAPHRPIRAVAAFDYNKFWDKGHF